MKIHKNARLTPLRREEMAKSVLAGEMSRPEAARSFGVAPKTVSKWVGRFRDFGPAGMPDRSSRPRRMRRPTPGHVVERIVHLRRHRLTGAHIAVATGVSAATVSRILKRAGLSRIKDLEPEEPARRYEHDHPGDMIHLDIKRLGRFAQPGHRATGTRAGRRQGSGWEYAHICVDDASRVACGGGLFPNERQESAVQSLRASVDCYKRLGVTVRRVMTDNGPCYTSKAFATACRRFGVRHVRTRPYTPRTNGGAELHPDGHEGMGLRPDLPDFGRARGRLSCVDAHVQLAQAALRHRFEAAHQPHPNGQRQPVASPQRAARRHVVAGGLVKHLEMRRRQPLKQLVGDALLRGVHRRRAVTGACRRAA